ncbi:MAG: dimethyl sulfoxide reductase anchor subunit family protein [Arenimonas sp.]
MNPAFSVIFFTVMSGLGYGIWALLGWRLLLGYETSRAIALVALGVGGVLVTVGLLSSLLHLGQPQRAWRAFSQWGTSWLSREGVCAVLSFVPALALAWCLWSDTDHDALRWLGAALIIAAAATTYCTAMIYASLKPVPAWRNHLVPINYLVLAGYTGGLAFAALRALGGAVIDNDVAVMGMLVAVNVLFLKRMYWREVDLPLPLPRAAALGLPHDRTAHVFERPHTEANYLLKEMGYVLARRHSTRLRGIALVLLAVAPWLLLLPVWQSASVDPAPWLVAAAISALLGAFVERWLFFAEARHLVTLYY